MCSINATFQYIEILGSKSNHFMSEKTRGSTTLAETSCEVPLAAAFSGLWYSYFDLHCHDYLDLIIVLLTSDRPLVQVQQLMLSHPTTNPMWRFTTDECLPLYDIV